MYKRQRDRVGSPGLLDDLGLFAEERFDPAFRSLEDMDMGLRLSKRFDLRIHFDGSVRGTMTRGMRFPDICRRQYVLGYYVFQLMRAYASELGRARPPYDLSLIHI